MPRPRKGGGCLEGWWQMSAGGAPPQSDRSADRISLRRSCATPKELIFDLAPGPPPPSGLQTECDNEGSLVANRSTVGTSWTVLKPLWGSLRTGKIEAKLIEKQEAQGGVGSRGLNSPCSGGRWGSCVFKMFIADTRLHNAPTFSHQHKLAGGSCGRVGGGPGADDFARPRLTRPLADAPVHHRPQVPRPTT